MIVIIDDHQEGRREDNGGGLIPLTSYMRRKNSVPWKGLLLFLGLLTCIQHLSVTAVAGPVTSASHRTDTIDTLLPAPPFPALPSTPHRSNDFAIVPPIGKDAAMMPEAPPPSVSLPGEPGRNDWLLPVIGRKAYMSGGGEDLSLVPSSVLPLNSRRKFYLDEMTQQSNEFSAIRALLTPEEDEDEILDQAEISHSNGLASLGANDKSGRVAAPGTDFLALTFAALAVEALGPIDGQVEQVRKAISDLRDYVAVAQPRSNDIIMTDSSRNAAPVSVKFQADPADQKIKEDRLIVDPKPIESQGVRPSVREYTEVFSFNNLWEFLTGAVMIALYVLGLALWLAWRYVLRRFV